LLTHYSRSRAHRFCVRSVFFLYLLLTEPNLYALHVYAGLFVYLSMHIDILRLGNFLQTKDGYVKVVTLTTEPQRSMVAQPWPHKKEVYEPGADILPIPLTPEWALRLGFIEKNKVYQTYYNGTMHIKFVQGNCWMVTGEDYVGIPMKFVHDLQNRYFSMTGDELKTAL